MPGTPVDGFCAVCGWEGEFRFDRAPARVARDLACGRCASVLVYQAEASVLLDEFGLGLARTIDDLVARPHMTEVAVLNVGRAGPIRNRMQALARYEETTFLPQEKLGAVLLQQPRRTNQDHERFTFPDDTFDLMTSSHVLEHVPEPRRAFAEAMRVLRAGGRYIFTVPISRDGHPSRRRAEVVDGEVVHHLEPQFHRSPEGAPALVFTDFGADVLEDLASVGFFAAIRRPHRFLAVAQKHFVVVAQKSGVPHWSTPRPAGLREDVPPPKSRPRSRRRRDPATGPEVRRT